MSETEQNVQKSIYMPESLVAWLEEAAAAEDRSFNKQVVRILVEERHRRQNGTSAAPAYVMPDREYEVKDGVLQPDTMRERPARPDPRPGRGK